MKKRDLLAKIEALGDIDEAQRNRIACTFIGHSNVIEGCFGYMHCARCGDQIGDTLGGAYTNAKAVIVGHACDVCRENATKLTWQDKLFVDKAAYTFN